MNTTTNLSAKQLKRVAAITRKIASLRARLNKVFGIEPGNSGSSGHGQTTFEATNTRYLPAFKKDWKRSRTTESVRF